MGGKVPLGWAVDPADGARMVPEGAEREGLATLRRMAREGATVREVVAALNERHPRRDGRAWARSTVARWMAVSKEIAKPGGKVVS